jgi:hypothetical protein
VNQSFKNSLAEKKKEIAKNLFFQTDYKTLSEESSDM